MKIALAVYAKYNKSSVVTLGETSRGECCAVRQNLSPIGSVISSSSTNVLSKYVDNKYVSVESVVNPEHALTLEKMFDRDYIVNNIKTW